MLIRFFKSSYSGQYFGLLIVLMALWLPVLLQAPQLRQTEMLVPLWDLLVYFLSSSPLLAAAISFLVIFVSALILNHTLSSFDLIPKNSLEGAFVFVLISGTLIPDGWSGPLVYANFFFILLLNVILKLYEEKEAYRTVFSVGILVSIIFLFYPPMIYLIIPSYFVIVLMGNVRWRELFIPLVGFLLPLIFTLVFYFMIDEFDYFTGNFLRDFTSFKIIKPAYSISLWALIALWAIMLMSSLLNILGSISGKNIDIRKKLTSFVHFLFFAFFIFLFLKNEYHSITMLIAPMSGIVAYYFSWRKKTIKLEIIVWIILAIGLLRNYHLIGF